MCNTSELLWRVLVQLEAAKADREKVQGDISFRNTRIEEVCFCARYSVQIVDSSSLLFGVSWSGNGVLATVSRGRCCCTFVL